MSKIISSLYHVQKTSSIRTAGRTDWIPNTDVYIASDTLVIKVEVAGIRQEDLELSIDGSRLILSGERTDECRSNKCNFLVMEINYGRFECAIEIPSEYNLSLATATYRNGFLRIDIPRSTTSTNITQIPIRTDS